MKRSNTARWKLLQQIYLGIALLVLVIFFNIPVSHAQNIYPDEELFEKGYEAYYQSEYVEAASFLFAYIQREPERMRTNSTHKKQVLKAVEYAMSDHDLPAGTTGRVIKPHLDKLPKTSNEGGQAQRGRKDISILRDLLAAGKWERAKDYTWDLIVAAGDKNGDGWLNYPENDSFPCSDLRTLSNLWKEYYGSSGGYDDILIPRFHTRFVSCEIWRQ